ncbi:type II toxin-antitoxin system RelE/ParE family toxin [Thiocapsa marina]|uniref:Plasmid maintenance system killer n=1 Tax=Thiocapsa marina 5811 TaxID=768671 RepID=F9U9A1_9GAMM|nr:plasmid maintenance system killer [Thiocapsa marina 5811]
MIKGFRCKETESIAQGRRLRRFPPEIQRRAKMLIDRIDAASALDDLRLLPSHRLNALFGNRAGQ